MKKIYCLFAVIYFSFSLESSAQNIFISVDGNDTNSGTIDQPLKTITAAVNKIQTGDTIFIRGGNYTLSSTITISKNGTDTGKYFLFAYNNERPVLDFSSMAENSSNRGINFKASYWHVKGIDIKGAGDNGMNLSGSNNIIEFCSFYENKDTGLQLSSGASNNQIINCDSYFNADSSNGNADGFAPKLSVGANNYFYGCRAWQNSDDGWDGYLRESTTSSTILENCWCFNNGYLKNGNASSGNGNGYKMGGGDNSNSAGTAHNFTLKNCLAFDNRVKGFDQNNNKGSMTILNCSAYRNGTNYSFVVVLNANEVLTISNCAALGNYGSITISSVQNTNSWMAPFSVSEEDFISIDTTGVRGPRKDDGSLPDINFLRLAENSDLVNTGTDIGLPYNSIAPDLGAFESDFTTSIESDKSVIPQTYLLSQNYPNPFNPETIINYQLPVAGRVQLKIYDILGKEITTLVDKFLQAGNYNARFSTINFQLSSGIYFYKLKAGSFCQTKKMLFLK
jgi:hypothetical protein